MNTAFTAEYSDPKRGIKLFPISCIHWPLTKPEMLEDWVAEIQSDSANYAILLGDQFEGTRTSFRSHLRSYSKDTNSQATFDNLIEKQVAELAKKLQPISDRIIGVLQGNHFYEFCSKITSDQLLCQQLGVPFLGAEAGIRLTCKYQKEGRTNNIVLATHHHGGSTGGKTFSGDANSLHKFEMNWDADIYLLGHTHKTLAFQTAHKTLPSKGSTEEVIRRRLFVRCGCMRYVKPDVSSNDLPYNPDYSVAAGYAPLPFSWPEIQVSFARQRIASNKGPTEIRFRTTIVDVP